ncbi:autotransporter outer membrane beta-barrel domain-containing protein [Fusobacterium varium]|uniref:autotransporter family protein n=1 Tax=Fusobacterium TaxID=848 RepID=UPI0030D2E748
MIEKIMKSIKSGNKKTGRNITIGTVVGMLLSCTAVMGADKYLWIKENGETVKFNTVATTDAEGTGGNWNEEHPYDDENIWNADTKTYINNMTLLSTGINITTDGYARNASCALKLSGDLGGVINNSLIMGADISNVVSESSGIYIYNSSNVETITNNGLIAASAGYSSGIYNFGAVETLTNTGSIMGTGPRGGHGIRSIINTPNSPASLANLTNTGLIAGVTSGTGSEGAGITYLNANMETLTNSGLIKGIGNDNGWGILIGGLGGTSGSIVNNGLITGTGGSRSCGIANRASGTLETMTNTGVIYGRKYAVDNDNATITSLNNYGILAAQTSAVISLYGTQTLNNYGLMFKGYSGNYTAKDDTDYGKFGTITEINEYTVINTKAEGGNKDNITGTESLEFENGVLAYNDSTGNPQTENVSLDKKYILNGITYTLLVSTGDNKFNNSVINGYETAVKFDTAGGILTLTGTIVNGGADGISDTVTGSDNEDTLTLQSGSIVNGNISMENGNDIFVIGSGATINGNTNMGDNDDILTVEAESIINGTLNGGMGRDTLNFDSPITRDAANGGINIYHNISGFENMNINTNVTLFEKTVKDDGSVGDLTVTDAENITIGAGGILTLRIDISKLGASGDAGKIVGHALYGNTGTIASTGGKLLLAVNGAGNESIISFGGTELDNSLITGSRGNFDTTSKLHTIESIDGANNEVKVVARWIIPEIFKYKQLNKIYHGILSVDGLGNFIVDDDERLSTFIGYLNDIYAGNPYSYSSELSRKSAGMFRDIVTENIFKPEANKWMIYGGLTHVDGGTKDTYYGKGYYTYDIGSSDMDADTKITGAYILGEYGVSDTLTSGVVIGGNKLKSDLSNGSKVDGSALYLGAYAKKYIGNLKVTAGTGFQYGDYDADRLAVNKVASDTEMSVMKYSDNYNDMTYDIYLNGRYSHNIGDNLFLEPYGTLSYTYVDQDGANEGSKALAIETDSKSFDYTVGKVGVDLKKVIPHEKGKSTLSAGVSYTKILDGADEEHITGRFKGGSDFDILVAHKNEHSIGLNVKYALELENGVLFDVKGTYAVERDSHNQPGKNKTKGEWIVGAGLGYKF